MSTKLVVPVPTLRTNLQLHSKTKKNPNRTVFSAVWRSWRSLRTPSTALTLPIATNRRDLSPMTISESTIKVSLKNSKCSMTPPSMNEVPTIYMSELNSPDVLHILYIEPTIKAA